MVASKANGGVHGRRGGGWVPEPAAEPTKAAKESAEKRDERIRIARARLAEYEAANPELVPGSAIMVGGHPAGGIFYEDLARMALARRPEDRNALDLEAIRRHPRPRSGVTGLPSWGGGAG